MRIEIHQATPSFRSSMTVLARIAVFGFLPFLPVCLLAAAMGLVFGFERLPFLAALFRLILAASVSTMIHEAAHACLLSWRDTDNRILIMTDWLRISISRSTPLPISQAFLCAIIGPCSGALTAMYLARFGDLSFGWLIIVQQLICLVPPCDDGLAIVECVKRYLDRRVG